MLTESKAFFFEKKEPKNFCYWCGARMMQDVACGGGSSKSFCFFFQKESLPYLAPTACSIAVAMLDGAMI
jgi:hypothetical protein